MNIQYPMGFPKVITLCGSTRFMEEFQQAMRDETLKGNIVIGVGMFGHQEGLDMEGPVKAMLDELHFRKIDMAYEILVIDPVVNLCKRCSKPTYRYNIRLCKECCNPHTEIIQGSYIGFSTRREIQYALEAGKKVRYLSEEARG